MKTKQDAERLVLTLRDLASFNLDMRDPEEVKRYVDWLSPALKGAVELCSDYLVLLRASEKLAFRAFVAEIGSGEAE